MRGRERNTTEEIHPQRNATIFVDNLPQGIRKIWIYNLFSKFGKINDIFIPRKRSKITGQCFGFVRFNRRDEAGKAIAVVNKSWFWDHRLVANFAKFLRNQTDFNNQQFNYGDKQQRSSRSGNFNYSKQNPQFFHGKDQAHNRTDFNNHPFNYGDKHQRFFRRGNFNLYNSRMQNPQFLHGKDQSQDKTNPNLIFQWEKRGKEIWRRKGLTESSKQGEERNATGRENHPQNRKKSIQILPAGNGWLYRSAIGLMRRLISAQETEEMFRREGKVVQVKPIGGRYLILTFPSKEDRDLIIKEKWLSYWFEDLKQWNGESASKERFVWISCYGMPLNAWAEPTFKLIGNSWGHFIQVDDNTLKENSFEKGKVLIATDVTQPIDDEMELMLGETKFMVRVVEESSFRVLEPSFQSTEHADGLILKSVEEDDEVDRGEIVKEANKTSGSNALDNLVVQDTEDAYKDASKENVCPNVIPLHCTVEHAELGKQALMLGTINSPTESKTAEPKDLENSNFSLGLESIVEDSGGLLLAGEHNIDIESVERIEEAQREEDQELFDTGLEELQKEAEKNLNLISGPIVIRPDDNFRASQVEGINLQVDLNPRKFRRALRDLTFEACSNSKECEEIQNSLTYVMHSQEEDLVLKELQYTKETGSKLRIDFGITDEMIMRKMIEIENKEYALLQRNKSA